MGVNHSTKLTKPFQKISEWSMDRYNHALTEYYSGQYDFGIDIDIIMKITSYSHQDAIDLFQAHVKSNSMIVNSLTLMMSIIVLGHSKTRRPLDRLHLLFQLLDFDKSGTISKDELIMLFLSIANAFHFILQHEYQLLEFTKAQEQTIILFAENIYHNIISHIQHPAVILKTSALMNKNTGFNQGIHGNNLPKKPMIRPVHNQPKKSEYHMIPQEIFCEYIENEYFQHGITSIEELYSLLTGFQCDQVIIKYPEFRGVFTSSSPSRSSTNQSTNTIK